eukprot:TRINITY_DN87209_c0_g1_i1.p1 TRINITY_DN87209_c0_g1~~TRINITY_DN87209_c0_g1_i1.p1  ORF type:complete len:107 (-),score=4.73 TRINITY_DN87209_c0_g1_i1:62-382(-)
MGGRSSEVERGKGISARRRPEACPVLIPNTAGRVQGTNGGGREVRSEVQHDDEEAEDREGGEDGEEKLGVVGNRVWWCEHDRAARETGGARITFPPTGGGDCGRPQ